MRLERDSLGQREISDGAYYGIETLRARENLPVEGRTHPDMIRHLVNIKAAAALANHGVGFLDERRAGAIVQACREIACGRMHEHFILHPIQDGSGTSFNMNANEVIANRALEILGYQRGDYGEISPHTHVNMSQSSNDVFPTALRLACLGMIDGLLTSLDRLEAILKEKANEFDQVLKVGRTHLQDAVPIRLGQEFSAYAGAVRRDRQRLLRVREELLEVNLGATAVGTGLNADPDYDRLVVEELSKLTGFPLRPAENLVDLTHNTDSFTALSSVLRVLACNLSKMANDIRLMASGPRAGFGEIRLPAIQPGSSVMPGKVNPVLAEALNQVCYRVIGNDLTVTLASEAGQLELNAMLPVTGVALMDSLHLLAEAVDQFSRRCLEDIEADAGRCRQLVEESAKVATALSPHLGYEQASRIAAESLQTGKGVKELCLDRGLLDPASLDRILSVEEMTRPGVAAAELLRRRGGDISATAISGRARPENTGSRPASEGTRTTRPRVKPRRPVPLQPVETSWKW